MLSHRTIPWRGVEGMGSMLSPALYDGTTLTSLHTCRHLISMPLPPQALSRTRAQVKPEN